MIKEEDKLYDLSEEQQLALIEFDKRNYKIIGNPCMEATKLYLRKNDYTLGDNVKISDKELIQMIIDEKPISIYSNRHNIEATTNELFQMNPNVGSSLKLIEFTKDPILLDYLCDEALFFLFEKYGKEVIKQTNFTFKNVYYSLSPEIIEKSSDRVKRLYKIWKMEDALKNK